MGGDDDDDDDEDTSDTEDEGGTTGARGGSGGKHARHNQESESSDEEEIEIGGGDQRPPAAIRAAALPHFPAIPPARLPPRPPPAGSPFDVAYAPLADPRKAGDGAAAAAPGRSGRFPPRADPSAGLSRTELAAEAALELEFQALVAGGSVGGRGAGSVVMRRPASRSLSNDVDDNDDDEFVMASEEQGRQKALGSWSDRLSSGSRGGEGRGVGSMVDLLGSPALATAEVSDAPSAALPAPFDQPEPALAPATAPLPFLDGANFHLHAARVAAEQEEAGLLQHQDPEAAAASSTEGDDGPYDFRAAGTAALIALMDASTEGAALRESAAFDPESEWGGGAGGSGEGGGSDGGSASVSDAAGRGGAREDRSGIAERDGDGNLVPAHASSLATARTSLGSLTIFEAEGDEDGDGEDEEGVCGGRGNSGGSGGGGVEGNALRTAPGPASGSKPTTAVAPTQSDRTAAPLSAPGGLVFEVSTEKGGIGYAPAAQLLAAHPFSAAERAAIVSTEGFGKNGPARVLASLGGACAGGGYRGQGGRKRWAWRAFWAKGNACTLKNTLRSLVDDIVWPPPRWVLAGGAAWAPPRLRFPGAKEQRDRVFLLAEVRGVSNRA